MKTHGVKILLAIAAALGVLFLFLMLRKYQAKKRVRIRRYMGDRPQKAPVNKQRKSAFYDDEDTPPDHRAQRETRQRSRQAATPRNYDQQGRDGQKTRTRSYEQPARDGQKTRTRSYEQPARDGQKARPRSYDQPLREGRPQTRQQRSGADASPDRPRQNRPATGSDKTGRRTDRNISGRRPE